MVNSLVQIISIKKRCIVDLYAVCNYITYMLIEYSNTMYDKQVWGQIRTYQNLLSYLIFNKYLLGDVVYILISYMVSPYKVFEVNQVKNTLFNKLLLYIYIDIKHTFSILKSK